MTSNELHAKGYSIQYSPWGVRVFWLNPVDDVETCFIVQFNQPLCGEESQRRGWEAAEVDLVKRRLEA